MVAVSPRRETTLPRMRTIWLVKESRYLAFTRGVASEAIVGQDEVNGRRVDWMIDVKEWGRTRTVG